MIHFRLSELLAEAHFKTGRRITLIELTDATGVSRITLSRMLNVRGYNTTTDTIDKLCKFFGCTTADLVVYVEEDEAPAATAITSTKLSSAASAPELESEELPRKSQGPTKVSTTKIRKAPKRAET